MSDEKTPLSEKELAEEQRLAQARAQMAAKLKAKGAQSMSYKEYETLRTRKEKAKAKKLKIPAQLKIALSTPAILIACFGVVFIPYVLFLIATGKPKAPAPETSKNSSPRSAAKKPVATTRIK